MKKNSLKEQINVELHSVTLNDHMKERIKKQKKHKHTFFMRYAAAIAAIIMLSGTTVFAGYYLLNKISVNETVLPELDNMEIIDTLSLAAGSDEYGMTNEQFTDYNALQRKMGISLLDSELAKDDSYIQGKVMTDNKDFAIITIENYILGDTSNFNYLADEGWYQYEHGEEYYSPVSLTVDLILSENQLATGWNTDYLGMYEYVESYTSSQGYKVNLIQDTTDEEKVSGYVSEKCAIFVVDGIRYTLKGRISFDTMRTIVDSMKI